MCGDSPVAAPPEERPGLGTGAEPEQRPRRPQEGARIRAAHAHPADRGIVAPPTDARRFPVPLTLTEPLPTLQMRNPPTFLPPKRSPRYFNT